MREARLPRIAAEERQRLMRARADRLAPALAALAERRTEIAHNRVARYFGNQAMEGVKWPRHIGLMAVECGSEQQP